MIVYGIENMINHKIYVGQTKRTVEERFKEHKQANSYIGKAIRKYGEEKFLLIKLAECKTPEQLNECEIYWIAKLDCINPKGYNLTAGGNGVRDFHPTDLIKQKISKKMTGRKQSSKHRANSAMAQQKRWQNPEEHKKASAGQKRRYENPDEHKKTSDALKKSRKENPISADARARQAKSLKNFYANNPAAIEHLSEMTNKQFETAESRKKHSEIMLQYYAENPVSDDTKNKQSESLKKFYKDNPDERDKISARNKERWSEPKEHEKASQNMKKYYEEHPEKTIQMSESQKKSYEENPDRRKRQSISQKARRARERAKREQAKNAVLIDLFNED